MRFIRPTRLIVGSITAVVVSCALITLGGSGFLATKTSNDTQYLIDTYFYPERSKKVLGADTQRDSTNPCPTNKPIIGWIDYRGQKRIVNYLGTGQNPSACFQNVDEAQADGFGYQD